jgi:DNA-binding MarR family transcriptional regulator
MMSEPKGRSGKKPKYQIADIGGTELTSGDISTERVLNFLIKGDNTSVEQSSSSSHDRLEDESVPSLTSQASTPQSPESSAQLDISSTEPPVKKSLSHLFERANSGGGPAKDLKLNLSDAEQVPVAPDQQQPVVTKEVETRLTEVSGRVEDIASQDEKPGVSPLKTTPQSSQQEITGSTAESIPPKVQATAPLAAEQLESSLELARYIDLWKEFYRLKSGEIDALSSLFRMSHDEKRSECYVKMRKLAEMSNLDYRYCQKVVRSLERLGWVTKLQDYDATTQLGVLYRVNLKPSRLP